MLIINGKMLLRVDGLTILPGETKNIPDEAAESLLKGGLVQKATKSPPEKAVMPPPVEKQKDYENMNKNEIVRELNLRGIEHNKRQVKAELIALLRGD